MASQIQKVIHGDSHQHENVSRSQEKQIPAKNCDTDAVRVSEHYASTPCTRTQRLTINRIVSKCRTRQPESCNTLSAFLHDWLERGAWTEPPTDLRLNDGRCWLPKAPLLLSPGASVRWSSGSTHMTTGAKPEVKSLTPEWSTAARSVMSPGGVGVARVSIRPSPRTARTTGPKIAQMLQCQCTRSRCRW